MTFKPSRNTRLRNLRSDPPPTVPTTAPQPKPLKSTLRHHIPFPSESFQHYPCEGDPSIQPTNYDIPNTLQLNISLIHVSASTFKNYGFLLLGQLHGIKISKTKVPQSSSRLHHTAQQRYTMIHVYLLQIFTHIRVISTKNDIQLLIPITSLTRTSQ
jgi:hypothetical protein